MGYLIVLGAGPDQVPVFVEARKMGIKTIAVDYNPDSEAFCYCDEKIIASVKDRQETILALKAYGKEYIGVMTLGVEISPVVSAVAKEFGLVSISEETAYLTHHKCARNQALAQKAIPIPKFQTISKPTDVCLPFPFVIKPSDNSASRGVQIVLDENTFSEAYEIAKRYSSDGKVLVEEQLSGPEISIEGFMINDKMHVTGFADRNYSRNPDFFPFFVEDGGDYPTVLPEHIVSEAKNVFEKAALALGICNGPSKGDLIVTPQGVKVIEITSRLSGGGFCSRIVPLQNGVNIVAATIRWACGQMVCEEELAPKFNKCISHRFYFHEKGRIKAITGMDRIKGLPGIAHVVVQRDFKIGEYLQPVSYVNRLFYVVATGDDRHSAIRHAQEAIESVKIITEID
ncbi:MAG: ATP-grasp domain-containing protein [Desulfobacteraceae bacterium]|nr:ATP-grasp domain-containing protein [Desulfobacteraceae bacterium]